jgi:hypothetical protein
MTSTSNNSKTSRPHKWLISILGSSRSPAAQSHGTKLAVAIGSCTIDLTVLDFAVPNLNVDVYVLVGSVTLLVPQDVGVSSTGMIILGSRRVEDHALSSPGGYLNINCIGALGSLRVKRQ